MPKPKFNPKKKQIAFMELDEMLQYFKAKADWKEQVSEERSKAMTKYNKERALLRDSKRAKRMQEKNYKPSTMSNNVVAGNLSKAAEAKVKQIVEWLGQGLSRIKLLEKIQSEFKYTKNTAVNYLHASYNYLREMSDEEREFLRDKHKAMLENLWQQNVERGDLREAHNIITTINKMFGLNEPEKTEHTEMVFEFKFNTATQLPPAPSEDAKNIDAQTIDYFDVDDDDEE